jgi:hypothetical protein
VFRVLAAGVALTASLALAAPASAATSLSGRVVGRPALHGAAAVVPVLLSTASQRAAHAPAPLVKLVVPARGGLRASSGRLQAGDLRLGDRVVARAAGRVRSGRVPASVLRVTARGPVASFAALDAERASVTASVQRAGQAVDGLSGVAGAPASSPAELRARLYDVRYDLNVLRATLEQTTAGLGATIAAIEGDRPAEGPRRDAVAAQQAPVLAALAGERNATLRARTGLEDAVTQLDQAILDVGGASAPALPLETVSAVNRALHAVMAVLDETDVGVPLVDGA